VKVACDLQDCVAVAMPAVHGKQQSVLNMYGLCYCSTRLLHSLLAAGQTASSFRCCAAQCHRACSDGLLSLVRPCNTCVLLCAAADAAAAVRQ
jgi:hypothetical protein